MQTPGPIEYQRATSVENAIALMEERGPDARVIAGGHSLLPMMKLRLANPELLIDLNDLEGQLSYIREQDGQVRIGALTRHYQLLESDLLARYFPIFADAEHVIADPVVRNRGTIGGSLAQADAAEDLSAVCTALKAEVVIAGSGGERVVGMDDFHVGPYMTAVGDAEVLTEIRIPVRAGCGSAHEKVERRAGDWAIVAVAGAVWLDGETIADAGLALERRRADHGPRLARRGAHARQGALGRALGRGGRDRLGGLLADRRRSRAGRLQAASGR